MKNDPPRRLNLKDRLSRLTGLLLILFAGVAPFAAPAPALAATAYVFATFQSDSSAGQKLWIYTSSDAVTYSQFAATGFGGSTGVLRDPTLLKHTDGKYYVAFTNQHWSVNSTTFGIASSTDLRTWTQIATVNSGIANTEFTWAPEWFNDGGTIKLIVNINLTTCSSDCFKSYVYTAQNSALTSWSAPVDMGLPACHIDTFAVRSGSTYHAFTVRCGGFVEHWTSSSLTGGWSNQGQLLSGYEGVSLVQLENGTWRMYADHYTVGDGIYTATSSNLNTWSSFTRATCSNCRHGTAVRDTNFSTPTPTPGGGTVRRLQSFNFQTRYVRHFSFRARIDQNVSPLADSQFRVVPGLSSASAVSFESVNFPGRYLRHRNGEIWVDANDGTAAFRDSATWHRRPGLANSSWSSYESYNTPGQYMRHFNFLMILGPVSGSTQQADATFREQP